MKNYRQNQINKDLTLSAKTLGITGIMMLFLLTDQAKASPTQCPCLDVWKESYSTYDPSTTTVAVNKFSTQPNFSSANLICGTTDMSSYNGSPSKAMYYTEILNNDSNNPNVAAYGLLTLSVNVMPSSASPINFAAACYVNDAYGADYGNFAFKILPSLSTAEWNACIAYLNKYGCTPNLPSQ